MSSATNVDVLRRSARAFGPHEAVWSPDGALTFTELFERSARLANGLRALGLEPTDRVGVLTPNGLGSMEEITGLALGGFVRVALHTRNTAAQHRYMLEHIDARALIVARELYEPLAEHLDGLEHLEHVIVRGGDAGHGLDYEALLSDSSPVDPMVPVRGADMSHIAFTSGTTGSPKAAVHTHRGLMGVTAQYTLTLPRFTDADRYLAIAPLSHAASCLIATALAAGSTTIVHSRLDEDTLRRIVTERPPTYTLMVPTMIRTLLDLVHAHPDLHVGMQGLRALVSTGAPLPASTAVEVIETLGPVLYNSYGQVEGVPAAMMAPEDYVRAIEGDRSRLGSVGRPGMLVRTQIVDDDGRELPPNAPGEIAIDTPGNMREYWGAPEATAARRLDDFILTRDIGYFDDEGYLFVVDRKDDMIISGGFNIWPAEIEQAIAAHPDVREVVAFGVPHEKWGETPWAVVVVRDSADLTEDAVVQWCRERIGSMKKPTRVEIRTESLAVSAVGKVTRRTVRDELLARDATAEDGPPHDSGDASTR